MYGLDTHEWLAVFAFAIAAISVVSVIIQEVMNARKHKREFDNNRPKIGDDYDPRKDVYDWKKDAPNDFS